MKRLLQKILATFFLVLALAVVVPSACDFSGNAQNAEAATVKINKKTLTLIRGKTATLKISGTSRKVTWSSRRPSIASVSSKGKVTAKKKGTTTITAKVGSKKLTCKVTVESPILSKNSVTLNVGKSTTIKLNGTKQKVTWKTSNSKVATVKNGKITAKGLGTATITATVQKKKYICKVSVKKKKVSVTNVSLDYDDYELVEGQTFSLKAFVSPSNATNKTVKWTSSNESVATVSNGAVRAVKKGTATITASCGSVKATCDVTVKSADEEYPKKILSSTGLNKNVSVKEHYVSSDNDMFVLEIKNNSSEVISITGTFRLYLNGDDRMFGSFTEIFIESGKTGVIVEYCECDQSKYTLYVEPARNYGSSISDIKYTTENTGHSVYVVIPEIPSFVVEEWREYDIRGYVLFKKNGKVTHCSEVFFYEWDENLRAADEAFFYGTGGYDSFEVILYKNFNN